MSSKNLKEIVEERLSGHSRCYGHCQEQTTLKFLPEKRITVGCYSCPSGYVSRMVTYGRRLNVNAFKAFISKALQGIGDVADEDIRVATRYTWDLGLKRKPEGMVLREVYWTQNYRRTKSEDPNRLALFLCAKCSSFYQQPVLNKNTLCPRCRGPIA
jgi:hypothetical protein